VKKACGSRRNFKARGKRGRKRNKVQHDRTGKEKKKSANGTEKTPVLPEAPPTQPDTSRGNSTTPSAKKEEKNNRFIAKKKEDSGKKTHGYGRPREQNHDWFRKVKPRRGTVNREKRGGVPLV